MQRQHHVRHSKSLEASPFIRLKAHVSPALVCHTTLHTNPYNVQGTGSERQPFAGCGSARSSFARRRPSTAPAAQDLSPPLLVRGSTSLTTYATSTCLTATDINKRAANSASRRRWEAKPLPLGPIPRDEGRKLRYPLLQLEREKARVASACGTRSMGDAEGRARASIRRQESHLDVPVTRDWRGRWQPRLVRVPCRLNPDQG